MQQNESRAYNRQLSGSVALEVKSDVKLVKFKLLPVDSFHSEPQSTRAIEPLSVSNYSNIGEESYKKLGEDDQGPEIPAICIDSKNLLAGANNTALLSYEKVPSTGIKQKPYVVVWKQLSFKIGISPREKITDFFNRIWPLSLQVECSKQQCTDFEKTDLNLHTNSEIVRGRTIFKNLNGFIKSGEISAILGPSGSGKTSLLNALCGKVENYRGTISLIGGGARVMRLSMIPQKDYLFENLTVKENLLYSSRILNSEKNFNHEAHIVNIVKMLNLTSCYESIVSNISGGEYKRVSIAQELMKKPDILILDEPTSGLDSLNCKNLIKSLARLIEASRNGSISPIAIVMTIHQPDIEVFHMFDHVYCMAGGGRVIYDGHPDDVMEVLNNLLNNSEAFESVIGSSNDSINPANLLIEIASEDIYGSEVISRLANYQKKKFELDLSEISHDLDYRISPTRQPEQSINKMVASKQTSPSIQYNLSTIGTAARYSATCPQKNRLVRDKRLNIEKNDPAQFWYTTNILAKRSFRSTFRDSLMTISSLSVHLIVPLVMWLVLDKNIGSATACPMIQRQLDMVSMVSDQVMEKINVLKEQLVLSIESATMMFMTTYALSVCSIAVTSLAFPLNMHILLKEVKNGWYSLPSFVFAKTIANFPFEILFPVMSVMIVYILIGLPSSYLEWRFWATVLTVALLSIISHTHGLIFGALCMDSVQTAIFLAISSTLPLLLLSGFAANIHNMPVILQYLSWISPYRYSGIALRLIRFGFNICPCDNSTIDYLKREQTNFLGIPRSMRSLLTYYLTSAIDQNNQESSHVATISTFRPATGVSNSTLDTIVDDAPFRVSPVGVYNGFAISELDRGQLLSKIESDGTDLFSRMAELAAKSFTYGRQFDTCDSIRSEALRIYETPNDNYLPSIILGMVFMIVVQKIILLLIVKYKARSRF